MPAWQWVLAVTGAGVGWLTLLFLGWAFWRSTRPEGEADQPE